MIRFRRRFRHSTALALALLTLWAFQSGCTFLGRDLPLPNKGTADSGKGQRDAVAGVKVESDQLALNETESAAVSPQQLADTISQLLAEEKHASAQCFARLYPDVAWDLLRNTSADEARNKAIHSIAAAYDRQCTRGDAASGWHALVLDRAGDPDRYHDHDRRRADFLANMRNGRPDDALKLGLTRPVQGAPGELLTVDAWHLTGVALLLDERPAEAAEALATAIEMAENNHPHPAAHLKLLLSDAQRRAQDAEAANATWSAAVQLAADMVSNEIPVTDPIFWERAAYLRPVDQPWPSSVTNVLARVCREYGVVTGSSEDVILASTSTDSHTFSREDTLWSCIGCWRLERGAPQAALVALKRAEAMTRADAGPERLQLLEAKALLALDQSAAATATLVRLAGSSDPRTANAAMATLGTAKLQAGNTQQGFNLLRRAVEDDETIDWPRRAEAEADLGLAYLLVGDEQAGLEWLHRAQARFESTGAHEHLVQSLENELDYLRQSKKKDAAGPIKKRLGELQAI